MAERSQKQRIFIEDARRDGQYLRATWHPEHRRFVLSQWNGSVCTGATQIEPHDAAALISLLASGMADATTAPPLLDEPRVLGSRRLAELVADVRARARVAMVRRHAPVASVRAMPRERSRQRPSA